MTLQLTIRPLDLKWASSCVPLCDLPPQWGPVKSVSGLTSRLASSSDFQTATDGCYDDDRAILTGGGDWRDGNDSDASEESDEVHSTEPMKLQLNILFAYPLKQQMLLFAYVSRFSSFMPMKMFVGITFIQK